MHKLRQVWAVCAYNFRQWWKNPRIFIVFAMALVLCFLLSDKAVQFAIEQGTTMQLVEAFVWTFGDSTSILLTSLLLILLFADMPFITMGTPFFLMRTSRKVWLTGQILYIVLATALHFGMPGWQMGITGILVATLATIFAVHAAVHLFQKH